MSRASWFVLAALAACTPVVAPRSEACLKDYPSRPKIAVLSTVSPRASFESGGEGVGLADCAKLQSLKVLTSDGDERGVYNRFVGKKVRSLDDADARSLGLRGRFLLVEAELDCGGACRGDYRFAADYSCGPGPVLTSLRVLEGTAAYPFRLDDVVTRAERQHRDVLAQREQTLRDLVARAAPVEPRATLDEETVACVDADAGIHVRVRTVVQRHEPPCPGTDCYMMRVPTPRAELVSDFDVARDGRITSVRVSGPTQSSRER